MVLFLFVKTIFFLSKQFFFPVIFVLFVSWLQYCLHMFFLSCKTASRHPTWRNVCQRRGSVSASSGQLVRERDCCRRVFSICCCVGWKLHHHPQHVGPTTETDTFIQGWTSSPGLWRYRHAVWCLTAFKSRNGLWWFYWCLSHFS